MITVVRFVFFQGFEHGLLSDMDRTISQICVIFNIYIYIDR